MVNGSEKISSCQPSGGERPYEIPCIVVDLDGTLLRANSLRLFIRYMVRKLWRERRVAPLMRICGLLAARRMRIIPHKDMKYPVHRIGVAAMSRGELEEFAGILRGYVCRPLLEEISRLKGEGWRVLLATAAPSLYIPALTALLGIDDWIATPLSANRSAYEESRGEMKRDLVSRRAVERGWTIRAVATDHEDDLPLLRLEGVRRLLVNSTIRLNVMADRLGLAHENIDG